VDQEADSDDLDALLRRVDPDRWLSSRFIGDVDRRADVVALYAYDHELARAPRVASNPLLGEIFQARSVRHHPAAQALARAVVAHDLPRAPLEAMIDARYRELDPSPMSEAEALEWARDTGGLAAELGVRVLDPAAEATLAGAAGAAWALGRHRQAARSAAFPPLLEQARAAVRRLSVAAFPAVAHAALAGRPDGSELSKRLRLTLAVARGRI
jgi:15-cis-phytoene synthase